jgi:hypothetical protein
MPTVARTSGGEVARRPEDGADRLGGELGGTGVWHGWGRKTERIGSGVGGLRLLKVLRCAGQRGKAEGGPGSAPRGGREAGKREGAPGAAGIAQAAGPSAGGHQRWHCGAIGEGGGARAADGRDRVTTGNGGQRLGAGRVRGSGAVQHGALTGGPDNTVPAGRVLNPIQTDSNNSKRFKRIQNCPNSGRVKSCFPCSKNGK